MSNPSKRTLSRKPLLRHDLNLHALLEEQDAEMISETAPSETANTESIQIESANDLLEKEALPKQSNPIENQNIKTQESTLPESLTPDTTNRDQTKNIEMESGMDLQKAITHSETSHTPDTPNTFDTPSTEDTLHTDNTQSTHHPYEKATKSLSTNKLNKHYQKHRKANRKKEDTTRIKFTTTLHPKYLEMIDEVSLQERCRDKNEWLEKILTLYAKKIGYDLT